MQRITKLLLSLFLVLVLCFSFVSCSKPSGDNPFSDDPADTSAPQGELAVHFLDVDQGDAILIIDGNKTMMIDTGDWPNDEYKKYMLDYIKDLGITVIDYLILTHPDADHIGGAPEVINTFEVKNCIMPDCTKTTSVFTRTLTALEDRNVNVLLPIVGDEYTLNEAKIRILAPIGESYKDTNDYSVVFRLQYGERSILFTGDAEQMSESEMVARYKASDLDADVLKVGHHGSRTSTSEAFLQLVDPDYAVISCGVGNSYGHPHDPVIARLNNREIEIYRTDEDGTIVLLTDGKTVSLTKLGKQ